MHADTKSGVRAASLTVIREPAVTPMSPLKREICWNYGIPARETPFTVVDGQRVTLGPGRIVLLTGPSGSGKSSLLHAVAEKFAPVHWASGEGFVRGRSIVDAIAPRRPLAVALEILTTCGLGEPRLWIRQYGDLSDGEKFRAQLARAIGRSLMDGNRGPILCDEFTAILHRRAARAIAYNLRKMVSRCGLTLVVATTHTDVVEDLQPDQVIRLGAPPSGAASTRGDEEHCPTKKALSILRRARIEAGTAADYGTFAPMHYRHRDRLGFVDKVFLLRESAGGDPLGILVYAHAPVELALRNAATDGRFIRNVRRLNRELRILRRLVMHPDIRGCGLGHWFVQHTLPRVGVRFVECLAAMGAVNPVFEKAGMTRIGRCPVPRGRLALLERMKEWGLDPFADDFPRQIARYPKVRRLVEETVARWATTTHSPKPSDQRCKHSEELSQAFRQLLGDPPMYYLWDREREFCGGTLSSPIDRHDPSQRPRRDRIDDHRSDQSKARHDPNG